MQALALKYRPKNYDELIGQDTIAKSLSHALDVNRLSHAYLFSGLRGSGKTSSARIFAKALICQNGPTSKPCEVCDNCKAANEGRHIDIIEMDAASHRKIDDIRELIEQTKYSPASARFKIFIIDEVHMLTKEASNALLKTLEEPPAYVKFILATTDPLKLPATVLSRTQHFRFKPISKNAVVSHLEHILKNENIPYELNALEILARSGSGSLRDTLTLLDQAIIYSAENVTQSAVADMLGLLDPAKIDEILSIITTQNRQKAIEVIKEIENYNAETVIDEFIANLKDKFLSGNATFTLLIYERFFRILSESKSMLNVSVDNGFTLSMMIFMMMEAVNLREIDELIELTRNIDMRDNVVSENFGKKLYNEKISNANSQLQNKKQGDVNAESQNKNFEHTSNLKADKSENTDILSQDKGYENFLKNIYDRDFELGEKFVKCIKFLKFENNTLHLASNATGEDQDSLRKASKAIMQVLAKSYNANTTIKIEQNADSPNQNLSVKNDENLQDDNKKKDENSVDNSAFLKYSQTKKSNDDGRMALNELKSLQGQNSLSKNEILLKELTALFGEPTKINE